MVHIAPLRSGQGAAFVSEWTLHIDQVDQRGTGAKLGHPEARQDPLDLAAEHSLIPGACPIDIRNPEHDVIEPDGLDGWHAALSPYWNENQTGVLQCGASVTMLASEFAPCLKPNGSPGLISSRIG